MICCQIYGVAAGLCRLTAGMFDKQFAVPAAAVFRRCKDKAKPWEKGFICDTVLMGKGDKGNYFFSVDQEKELSIFSKRVFKAVFS